MSLTEISLIASSFWICYWTCIECKMKAALELRKGDRFVLQDLVQGKYQEKMSFVLFFLPTSQPWYFLHIWIYLIYHSILIPQNEKTTKEWFRELWLFYRFTTNVLYDPDKLLHFSSTHKIKVLYNFLKKSFERWKSFKILVKWEKPLSWEKNITKVLYIKVDCQI